MTYLRLSKTGWVRLLLPVTGLCLNAASAAADVKVVAKVMYNVANLPSATRLGSVSTPVPPQIVTTYYRGANARTEIEGGTVTIYNGKEGKVYLLDPSQKIYLVEPLKEFLDPQPELVNGQTVYLKAESRIRLGQGSGARACAGFDAKPFTVNGSISVGVHKRTIGIPSGLQTLANLTGFGMIGSLLSGGGSGRGSGDDEGGGRQGVGGTPSNATKRLEVSGEYWLSESLKLPNDKKADPLPGICSTTQIQSFVFHPVADYLLKLGDLPLDSRLTVTTESEDGSKTAVTRTSTVVQISQESLADDLFTVPAGYSRIVSP